MARTSTSDARPTKHTRHTLPRAKKGGADATLTHIDKGTRSYLNTSSAATAALVDPDKPLTELQVKFVKLWAAGDSIPNACVRAGYSDDGLGYRMSRMPNILKAYNREKRLYEESCQMTRKKVMDMLLEGYEMAKLMAEPATMVSAAREVGKMCGYYEPIKHTLDVNIKGDVTVRQLNAMSDADLLKIISDDTPLQLPDLSTNEEDEHEGT